MHEATAAARAAFIAAIENALPTARPGMHARDVHRIVDLWSHYHVDRVLRALEQAGRVVSDRVPTGHPAQPPRRLYRRTSEPA